MFVKFEHYSLAIIEESHYKRSIKRSISQLKDPMIGFQK
jgi:hypothetical protein